MHLELQRGKPFFKTNTSKISFKITVYKDVPPNRNIVNKNYAQFWSHLSLFMSVHSCIYLIFLAFILIFSSIAL